MNFELTIDRFEGDKAVLRSKDGYSVIWPKNQLPKDSREGTVLYVSLSIDAKNEKDQKDQAKNILNEILNQ